MGTLKQQAKQLKGEVLALYFAYRNPRTPWYAKVWAACVVAYALSPIDLIPDFIPVLGYLDDLVLVPLGIVLAVKMIPETIMIASRARAQALIGERKPANWIAAGIIILVWLLLLWLIAARVLNILKA
ncbi:MAG: DUF1232 domain-containing protein [Deinococcus sp.]|nr:DUF1232 domain-containing protein [Deinococcus sp.]